MYLVMMKRNFVYDHRDLQIMAISTSNISA